MPINPIGFRNIDLPPNPTLTPPNFSTIGDIGNIIGAQRERQRIGQLLQGAIDPRTGQLDIGRAAAIAATAGIDPHAYLNAMVSREALATREAAQRSQEAHYRATEQHQQRMENAPISAQVTQPTLTRPGEVIYTYRDGRVVRVPLPIQSIDTAPTPTPTPMPTPSPAPAPIAPGPRSELPGTPMAAINPEEAPPYRVAGPPMPPPTGLVAPPTPTPAPPAPPPIAPPPSQFNEDYLRSLPNQALREAVKGVATYTLNPATYDQKTREDLVTMARQYNPNYNQAEYEKRAAPVAPTNAASIGIARSFLERLNDRTLEDGRVIPGIKSRVAGGELTANFPNRLAGFLGRGTQGELRDAISEGSTALRHILTGQGENVKVAEDHAQKYQVGPFDTTERAIDKLNSLEEALRYSATEMEKRRSGEDFLKGYRSQFGLGRAVTPARSETEVNQLIGFAKDALQKVPTLERYNYLINDLRMRNVPNPERFLNRPAQ